MSRWILRGATCVTEASAIKSGSVTIKDDKIESVSKKGASLPIALDVEKAVLVPGLINGHDHLLGTYFPKVGNGPYENWLPWDNDLKSAPLYNERQQVENRDLYLLGAFRNLVSGVTTVSDHIPHFVAEPYYDILPTKAIRNYALAHSIASFALNWGDGVDVEYQKALKENIPFITHIAEGFDSETVRDLMTLNRQGGLGDHSVLVHGIAFSESDMKLIKQKGASVVWCADSNVYMFNKTTNIKMLLDCGINVCIGTDSPMSGGLNLLYEMKFDKALYGKLYGKELPDAQLLKMVTTNPAKAFWLKQNGHIREGYLADLVLFRDQGDAPASSVVKAELGDVMLVVINGKPVYGNAEYSPVFDKLGVSYKRITMEGVERVIVGDPVGLLKRISRAVKFKKEFPFFPVDFEF
jgi:5-methylthioadenosine/S-adenosylhomocysteine deaminase